MTISTVKSTTKASLRNEWRTPPELFSALHREFDFKVDVAATPDNTLCKNFYTAENSALTASWVEEYGAVSFWMNCPWAQKREFLAKANEQARLGATVVCLVRAGAPETRWWREACKGEILYAGKSGMHWVPKHEIRFLFPRVKYTLPGRKQSSPDFPSALIIMRPPGAAYHLIRTHWWTWETN